MSSSSYSYEVEGIFWLDRNIILLLFHVIDLVIHLTVVVRGEWLNIIPHKLMIDILAKGCNVVFYNNGKK